MTTIIPILGDQLTTHIPSLKTADRETAVVLFTECMDEATYIPHHQKKLVFVFSCMRHFAEELRSQGWRVDYIKLDDADCPSSITDSIQRAIGRHAATQVMMTEAAEYRLQQSLHAFQQTCKVPMSLLEDTRFLCSQADFRRWADNRNTLRMENFYRQMRVNTGLLMEGDKPVGGNWNFDKDNRKPAKNGPTFSSPKQFKPDDITKDCIRLVEDRFSDNIGHTEHFWFAVSKDQAQAALRHFIKTALPTFGDYQDAMLVGERFLSHSVLSLYINAGLLDPLAVCQQVEQAYQKGHAPINACEGFIRQIIGWREYVRGIYWLKMPDYLEQNYFNHTRALPDFYWTGDTRMACLQASIDQTIQEAYAHHIQRLMITGNFAMLIGVDPKAVHEWYLAVYADAFEWVELPNTLGMSQFADGGLLGSKPYAAGGNYINKMSDYCRHCSYKISQKVGDDACPFNYLYWHFLHTNRKTLASNHRLAQPYRTWERMEDDRKTAIIESAIKFIAAL